MEDNHWEYEVPDTYISHDVCECSDCHKDSSHDENKLYWYDGCDYCTNALDAEAIDGAFKLAFYPSDITTAKEWARRHRYRYETVDNLLFDAMSAGAIGHGKMIKVDH